jgi:hypothetical protein
MSYSDSLDDDACFVGDGDDDASGIALCEGPAEQK